MACCCKPGDTNKSSVSCLGRCDLPKHKCLSREDTKPGPVPKYMGWQYTAKTSPGHQLRCGWRPGHIACPVLKKIERHNCTRLGECSRCPSVCCSQACIKPCCMPTKCVTVCPSPDSDKATSKCPTIRIMRHDGKYTITTDPPENSPSGPAPLKYVINTDDRKTEPKVSTTDAPNPEVKIRYSVEGKFNDTQFDYTSSQSSFVIDFSPPGYAC